MAYCMACGAAAVFLVEQAAVCAAHLTPRIAFVIAADGVVIEVEALDHQAAREVAATWPSEPLADA